MSKSPPRLLVIQAAALGHPLLDQNGLTRMAGLDFRPLEPVFPAVTCVAQASFRTASGAVRHGLPGNGFYARDLRRVLFWEQASALVRGPRIWDSFRARGGRVAMLFWQQSLGESVDLILSPAPIHKHGGGMVPAVYSEPAGLYDRLCARVGRPFRLHEYWGPLASPRASDWIARATAALLADTQAPDLCLTYLPALDYDLQRYGPDHARSRKALQALKSQIEHLVSAARGGGYDVLVVGDYAIGPVHEALHPNRMLREAGFFQVRRVGARLYPDFHRSRAVAVADHEVALVYTRDPEASAGVCRLFEAAHGISAVLPAGGAAPGARPQGLDADLILQAEEGNWMSYRWWDHPPEAPDYATHVDIHNKPGYDPCELFFGWPPMTVSQSEARIRGSHGRMGPGRQVAWASTLELASAVDGTFLGLASALREWLNTGP